MRVLGDILALPDITEVESHRLSELCRILHALEGLFIEDPGQVRALCVCLILYSPECSLPLSSRVSRHGSSFRIYLNFWYVVLSAHIPALTDFCIGSLSSGH